jgi:hypothetical protein
VRNVDAECWKADVTVRITNFKFRNSWRPRIVGRMEKPGEVRVRRIDETLTVKLMNR